MKKFKKIASVILLLSLSLLSYSQCTTTIRDYLSGTTTISTKDEYVSNGLSCSVSKIYTRKDTSYQIQLSYIKFENEVSNYDRSTLYLFFGDKCEQLTLMNYYASPLENGTEEIYFFYKINKETLINFNNLTKINIDIKSFKIYKSTSTNTWFSSNKFNFINCLQKLF